MAIPVYAINLDRSTSRWESLSQSAAAASVPLTRISGVDGKAIPPEERKHVSENQFRRFSGRGMRPGEYGCYQSHLKALRAIAEGDAPAGIVIEDDIEFGPDFLARAEALLAAAPFAGVIKLLNHRVKGFRPHAVSVAGDAVGRCLHGPQGSAACYLVTRPAAKALLTAMLPMVLPYDVELERGWKTGVSTYTVGHDLATLGPLNVETEIATRSDYRATRLSPLQRIPTHLFRIGDYARRILYALSS